MKNYPYITKTGTLKSAIEAIPKTGSPAKFTIKYLQSLGYKSPNDRPVIPILKFIGFLGSDGAPTENYKKYRGGQRDIVLGNAIKTAYADLFSVYSDAYQKDDESLYNFFSSHTTLGEKALKATAGTFKALCSLAKFTNEAGDTNKNGANDAPDRNGGSNIITPNIKNYPPININIELQVPPSTDPAVYENFFKALKKHILDN